MQCIAPLPSLKDAADALEGVCDDLSATMQEISDIAAELEHRDHVRVDNLMEVRSPMLFGKESGFIIRVKLIGPVDAESLRRMDVGQRRALACRVLEKAQVAKRSRVESLVCKCVRQILMSVIIHVYLSRLARDAAPARLAAHQLLHHRAPTLALWRTWVGRFNDGETAAGTSVSSRVDDAPPRRTRHERVPEGGGERAGEDVGEAGWGAIGEQDKTSVLL